MWKPILTAIWLGVLAGIDLWRKKIPLWILAASGVGVTCVSVYGVLEKNMEGIPLLWSTIPGVGMIIAAVISKKAGWADGVILSLLGALIGMQECAYSFTLSMLAISVVSLALLAAKRVNKNSKLPYLPFLWIGYLVQAALGLGVWGA